MEPWIVIFTSEECNGDMCLTGSCGQSPTENEPDTDYDPSWDPASHPKYTIRPPITTRGIPTLHFSFISYRKIFRKVYKKPAKKARGRWGSGGVLCNTGAVSDPAGPEIYDVNFPDKPIRTEPD